MTITEINSLSQDGLEIFSRLTDSQLRRRGDIFIAESPYVVERALDAGCIPVALLCERSHACDAVVERCGDIPVYTGGADILKGLTGYSLTRGVIGAFKRPPLPSAESVCSGARRVAVAAGVVDAANMGTIFRGASALGMDAVLVTEDSCDPLNRRSIRASMGTVFQVPWTVTACPATGLEGFRTVAMALADDAIPLDDPALKKEDRLAIILGNEGKGLPPEVIASADYVVKIPMSHGVDSLNVAAAAAVAFWELR